MRETGIIDTWLSQFLRGDAQLAALMGGAVRAHADIAPTGTPFPHVVWSTQSDIDVTTQNGVRIMVNATYLVKVIGAGASYGPLQPIANRLDDLLQLAVGTTDEGQVLSSVRTEGVKYAEISNGQQYRHLGGVYRIHARAV